MKISSIKLGLYVNKMNIIYNKMESMKHHDSTYIIEDKVVNYNGETKPLFHVIMDNAATEYAEIERFNLSDSDKQNALKIVALLTAMGALEMNRLYKELDGESIDNCILEVNEFVRSTISDILNDCKYMNMLKSNVISNLRETVINCGL